VECDHIMFADLVTMGLARWWRVAEARTPFSLMGRRNKKTGDSGSLAAPATSTFTAVVTDASSAAS